MKNKLAAITAFLIPTIMFAGCSSDTGGKLAKAGMNTLMGMGTVFLVLVFIAFVISRFKYISRLEARLQNRGGKAEVNMPVQEEIVEDEIEDDQVDDLELVAVITAALAASLGTAADQLVVRSIRRKKTNRW